MSHRGSVMFVYGTLRRGEPANGQLEACHYLGAARTTPAYTLLGLGWYPGLLAGGNTAVIGDLYAVDEPILAKLDAYEGPEYYRGEVALADGRRAIAYLLHPGPAAARGRPISTGDWRNR